MIPDFAGKTIAIVRVDYGLYLWTADNWEIRLAGPVSIDGIGAATAEIDVSVPDSPLPAELDGLVGQAITRLLVTPTGDLTIQFADRRLGARACADYESWQIAGHDGERLICTPGGELEYIPPLRQAR